MLFLLCTVHICAQDVIVKKDGSTILAKVLEVNQSDVKYKKFDNLNGPTYSIRKSELQSINYQNGMKDVFSTPVREENKYLPNNQNDGLQRMNDNALLDIDKIAHLTPPEAKKYRTLAWIGGAVFVCLGGGACLAASKQYDGGGTYIVAAGLAGVGVAWTTILLIKANHEKNKYLRLQSSMLYRKEYNLPNGSSLSLGVDMLGDRVLGDNTVGLGLSYNF